MALVNAFGDIALDTSVQAIVSKLPTPASALPDSDVLAVPVRQAPQKVIATSYAAAGSGVNAAEEVLIATGSGMAVNRTGGDLVITSGTTANSETVIRSVESVNGRVTFSFGDTLSQRIVNNNFYREFVDVIGDGLTYNIVNATTVDVTLTAHGFTSASVGQRMDICAITGAAGIPMEGVIASIPDVDTIRFTVAGWPASGSGTCSLTGWNKIEINYTGTGATAAFINSRRRGYQNTSTSMAITTTATGCIVMCTLQNDRITFSTATQAVGSVVTDRSVIFMNIPEPDTQFYYQIRAKNGTTNPASNTTWTCRFTCMQDFIATQVELTGMRQFGNGTSLPINGAVSISGTPAVTATVAGAAAHDAAISGNPTRLAGRALTANYTAVATGDTADLVTTLVGAVIQKPYSIPELDWSYAAASGGITNTTDVAIKTAAGAGLRNYLTSISIQNASATISTEVVVKDGSTVIFRCFVGTQALLNSVVNITFPSPLKSTANAALNVACITTAAAVYVNAQGYVAP